MLADFRQDEQERDLIERIEEPAEERRHDQSPVRPQERKGAIAIGA